MIANGTSSILERSRTRLAFFTGTGRIEYPLSCLIRVRASVRTRQLRQKGLIVEATYCGLHLLSLTCFLRCRRRPAVRPMLQPCRSASAATARAAVWTFSIWLVSSLLDSTVLVQLVILRRRILSSPLGVLDGTPKGNLSAAVTCFVVFSCHTATVGRDLFAGCDPGMMLVLLPGARDSWNSCQWKSYSPSR